MDQTLDAVTWRRVDAILTLLDELDSVEAFPCSCGLSRAWSKEPGTGTCKWCQLAMLMRALRPQWPAS
jgi:hypothetical protein